MKIAVCVKEVPEPSAPRRLDADTLRLDRSGEGTLNPWDLSAVEEALRLREAHGGEVLVLSMAPLRALASLRKALAMGADRALLVADEQAAGSDLLATSLVLSAALAREAPALVLFGQQGADSDGALLWAAVAERLQLPLLSQAATLTLAQGRVSVKRQTEYGYDLLEAPLPCLVAVAEAINEPRYPSLKGIMGAKKKPQQTLDLAALGLEPAAVGEAGSRTQVLALSPPPARGEATIIAEEGASGAEKLLAYLTERRLL